MQNSRYTDIFDFVKRQETAYEQGIDVNPSWTWSMKEHILLTELYTNSQLKNRKNDFTPVKNITRPILNLQHRTEDIEVKDVQIYVDDPDRYHLSFLVKKYHDDVFVVENDLDTFIDELNVSRIDFGGGLSKQLDRPCPEVVALQTIAFCDQTDILSGPIGIKHFYSPDQLLDMEAVGWGDEKNGATISIPELIELSREEKTEDSKARSVKTPGRYIEVYEVHGNLPKAFFNAQDKSGKYETRIAIVAFYQKKGMNEKNGVILYTAPEKKTPFKLVKRDPVHGRALGFGGAEELFEPQVWVNYDMIRMQGMLDAAAKTILKHKGITPLKTTNAKNMDNLEIIEMGTDEDLAQVDTFPRNLALFEKSVAEWEAHAQQMGAANDSIMGEAPTAGTPFKLQELVTQESHGLHEYRRGQFAKHLEEIYKDWIIPHIEKKICEGATFLSELSVDDLKYVTDCLVTREANRQIVEKGIAYLEGTDEAPTPDVVEGLKQLIRDDLQKKGNKYFIQLLKGEFKRVPLAVKVNVAGKQKNLAGAVDKIVNIFRFAFSNPQGFAQVLQIPGMAKSFNEILEFSGLSPSDFTGIDKLASTPPSAPQPALPAPAMAA